MLSADDFFEWLKGRDDISFHCAPGGMPKEVVRLAFETFQVTGVDYLEHYYAVRGLYYYSTDACIPTKREMLLLREVLESRTPWVFPREMKPVFRKLEAQWAWEESYERRRIQALLFTAKIRSTLITESSECIICGSSDDLTIDHITPVVKGGGNEIENLQVLCRTCNSSKGGR